jgi:hypothetical protein
LLVWEWKKIQEMPYGFGCSKTFPYSELAVHNPFLTVLIVCVPAARTEEYQACSFSVSETFSVPRRSDPRRPIGRSILAAEDANERIFAIVDVMGILLPHFFLTGKREGITGS